MKSTTLIFFLLVGMSFCYYSFQLNRIYIQESVINSNTSGNETVNNFTEEQLEEFEEYIDLPLNNSELNILNETYTLTKNIKSEFYTLDTYIGSNKQHFRLLLSTFHNYTEVASINCELCNVSNKYNSSFQNNLISTPVILNGQNYNSNGDYNLFIDTCIIYSEPKQTENTGKKEIIIDNLIFKVVESNSSWLINSNLIDGILSLSYSNVSQIPNNNFIMELYKEGKISSPSFSIIITSSNINRFYFGDIMKNEYVKNYVKESMNKGECQIIDDKWQCRIQSIRYTDLEYIGSSHTKTAYCMVKFNLTETSLIIPNYFYRLLVVGYRIQRKKSGKTHYTSTIYNKRCAIYSGIIYCSCKGKNSFGIVTFYFKNNSRLDVDLRDYVHFDSSAFYYKCRIDVILSNQDEFIIGLRGLNNTIISFDIDDKKIEFFHKKKVDDTSTWIFVLFLIILSILSYFAEYHKRIRS